MNIKEALQLVLDERGHGVVMFKGVMNTQEKTYTDMAHGKTNWSKKVMVYREKHYEKSIRGFIIIKVIQDPLLPLLADNYLVIIQKETVGFDDSISVGDHVRLNITSNVKASWVIERKCEKYDATKFEDRSERKKEREAFKKLSPEEREKWSKEKEPVEEFAGFCKTPEEEAQFMANILVGNKDDRVSNLLKNTLREYISTLDREEINQIINKTKYDEEVLEENDKYKKV
jgi:hypothetical protein